IPNNVFTPQEINSKFDALYKDLGEYQDEYNKLYEDYTSGRSILAPSINLLAITKPKVKLILEKLEKTLITMDEKTISQILNAMNDVSRALSQNKTFSEMIKKLQTDYPKLVKTRRVSDIANLVEQAVDTVQLIDMKTVIPPEKQGRNVPYTYLKTFLVLKTLTLTSWQVEEAQPQAPVSSSGGGHASSSQPSSSGAQPSNSSGQPSTDISQIKAMPFDALIAKHGELQKEIDDQKTPSASHGDLVNEAAKYRIEIEKRQRPSEFQFWKIDEHNKEVIPLAKNMEVIVLLRKTGEHLQPDEEHNIVEFMKEIKPIQKLKSVYTNNLVKIQKYQPHLVARIQQ
ncbi:MAG: hypothetical protein ACTHJ4_01960, partial [Candidatus Nucleicultricaceae bacterium]